MRALAPCNGSLDSVRPSELGRLCFKTTAGDIAGEALPGDARAPNMRCVRELRQDAANRRHGGAGSPSSEGGTPSSPSRRGGPLTRYSCDYQEKPTLGYAVNKELAEGFKPAKGARTSSLKTGGTDYAATFKGFTRSTVAAARPMPFPLGHNDLGKVIAQGSDPVTASHSTRQFAAPPKDLSAAPEQMPYPGCPYWLGAGTSSANFCESRYQLEFKREASPAKPRRLQTAGSAPDLRSGEGDPERAFRERAMRSHYKSQFSSAHQAPGCMPIPPKATDIRQTIIGR